MKITISIFTYIFYIILILSGYINYLIIYLFIMSFHELGHIISIKLFKYIIEEIVILPCGGIIKTNISININSIKQFIISVSGILFQLILLLIIKNNGSYLYSIFYKLNISIIIFNLTPIYPLDGYKILLSIMEYFYKYKIIIKISYIISIISLLFVFVSTKNIFIFIFLYIINVKYILNHKYYYNKFILERYLNSTKHHRIKIVDGICDFYKCFNNIMIVNGKIVKEREILENTYKSIDKIM
ncbi:MAG: hypothetical protein J5982_04405 [Bacilli bacterium]|nr:hypothetical protein [Bacilli bacterium]